MIKRLPDWRTRLIEYLAQSARAAFVPGTHDCALFLAGGVAAMTDRDYASDFRGKYDTTRAGLKLIKAAGFEDHIALARHHLRQKSVAFANEGDGAVVPGAVPALGIVQGAGVYVLREDGLGIEPLTSATMVLEV